MSLLRPEQPSTPTPTPSLTVAARPSKGGERVTNASGALATVPRTSNLQAPTMLLTGHTGEVQAVRFRPDGALLASAGQDKTVRVWNTFGDCKNTLAMRGHEGAVLDLQWSVDGKQLVTASADHTCGLFDAETGQRVKRMKGHSAIINSCSVAQQRRNEGASLVASCSDDGTVKLWDSRKKLPLATIARPFPITAVCFDATGDRVFFGGVDNAVSVVDLKAGAVEGDWRLEGHTETITSLRLSPDGSRLLSNAMDSTVRIWDVKPFSSVPQRQLHVLEGAVHGNDRNLLRACWSPDGTQCASGSADRSVLVWSVQTGRILYKLPGHRGTVNDVDWHPKEPILASGSTDRSIYLGELDPQLK